MGSCAVLLLGVEHSTSWKWGLSAEPEALSGLFPTPFRASCFPALLPPPFQRLSYRFQLPSRAVPGGIASKSC
eukprot:2086504-Heterocapsa_arctica.AAC.1